jgi:hypothetical protein
MAASTTWACSDPEEHGVRACSTASTAAALRAVTQAGENLGIEVPAVPSTG